MGQVLIMMEFVERGKGREGENIFGGEKKIAQEFKGENRLICLMMNWL